MSSDSVARGPVPDAGLPASGDASSYPGSLEMAGGLGRALFEQSPLSTVVYDPAGHPVAANAAFQRLWGVTLASIPREYSVLADPQLDAAGFLPLVRRAFAGEAVATPPVRYEMSGTAGEGRTTWTQAHWYPVRRADGGVGAVVLVHVDLTDRVEAEEALRLERERLQVALEAGRAGTWEWTIGEDRVVWSPELQRIHGLEPGTFGGTLEAAQRDVHPDDVGHLRATIERSLQTGEHSVSYRCVWPDGQVRWLEARGRLVRDAEGRPWRMLGTCTDVTERRRRDDANAFLATASELLHASLEVEETLRTVGRLAVPLLGDYCIFDVLDAEGGIRRMAAADASAPGAERIAEMERFPPSDRARRSPVVEVIASDQPYLEPRWSEEHTGAASQSPEHAEVIRALALRSVLSVPVTWRGTRYGALTFLFAEGKRPHDAGDVELAVELARRAAAALANAHLYAEVQTSREQMEQQAVDLELQARQLHEQADELQGQQEELEQQVEEMQALNEELETANTELAVANDRASAALTAARAAEGFTRGLLESIGDPFVVQDAAWRFRYINTAAAEVFRHAGHARPGTLVGQVVWDAFPELRGSRMEHEMRRAAAERAPVSFEEHDAASGTWSELRCYPLPDGGLATVWKDVTERRQAQQAAHYLSRASALLAASLDYEATLAAVAQMVVPELADWCAVQLVDEAGAAAQVAVAHADPSRVELARELNRRYPPDPARDPVVSAVLATGEAALITEIDDAMLVRGARDDDHLRLIRELGLRSAIVAPLAAGGRVLGTITLIAAESGRRYGDRDLQLATEIARRAGMAVENARLYAAAQTARDEAQQANRAKSEFLAVMSHELRTPLNAIGGYAELVEMGVHGPVTEAQRQALERIRRSQRHLLSLINDVLNYARIEAARVRYDLADVPVDETLGSLEALLAPQMEAKELRYEYAGCDPALQLRGDEEKVRQILLNLLSNAVKFTPQGGRVWISVAADAESVGVVVADSGVGIPADKLESVFEPFVQLGRGLTSGQEGTGLGLAISRDLARGMGGDLTLESVPGEGSAFTLRLPRADGRSEG